MKTWGYLFPIIGLDPDLMVAQAQRPCSVHAASPQPTWNLQVNTGKFASLPIIEEKRGEGILEGELEGDNTTVVLTCKNKSLSKGVGK